ncbi:hypothetical protein [Allorhizocola rhizosphaerae]|uniref:hypothetical protein n=1 Tax=Allorhizocola rhizosphaerae TaxID=1872709 RepID=UPI000E3D5F7D|nr:hypothetical protein [Allorhizocola rhizosphaerae]
MVEPTETTVLDLTDPHYGHDHFRIILKPPYGSQVADQRHRDWQDATFDVEAYPFAARCETTLNGREVVQVLDLIQRFWAGEDVEFDEDQQFRFALQRLSGEDEGLVLVTTTLTTEGGPYPELRFEIRLPESED